jgi:hypothetical protein
MISVVRGLTDRVERWRDPHMVRPAGPVSAYSKPNAASAASKGHHDMPTPSPRPADVTDDDDNTNPATPATHTDAA